MPDIFGCERSDYSHLVEYEEAGGDVGEYLAARAQLMGDELHNFEHVPTAEPAGITRAEGADLALGFVTNNMQAIMSQVDEIMYVEYMLEELIPMVGGVPPGAKTYAGRVLDRAGKGRFIDNDGSGAPSANVALRIIPYPLFYAGIVAEWTVEDLRSAMFLGVPLDTETIKAATTGAIMHMQEVALLGDDERKLDGLLTLPTAGENAVHRADMTKTFLSMTGDEQVEFLQNEVVEIMDTTKGVLGMQMGGDLCIYMPIKQASKVSTTKYGVDTTLTVWNYFKDNNAWKIKTGRTPMLKWVVELDDILDAPVNGSKARIVTAIKDNRIFELAIPIRPRVMGTDRKGYTVCAPIEYKMGGVNVKRPDGIRYADGA